MSVTPLIYRTPLWSQDGRYPAATDRRLIHAALWPGVIDAPDLKVVPRQEGSNMSVDVLPGEVVVKGSEQADQGTYLCELAQRVNIPIAAGPSAGNQRTDWIIARVYEPIDAEAYWQVEVFSSNPYVAGSIPPFPNPPPSFHLLAVLQPITSSTTQIGAGLILDQRRMSRPGPMGASLAYEQRLGLANAYSNNFMQWGPILPLYIPPYDIPVDIEARVEGTLLAVDPAQGIAGGQAMINLLTGALGTRRWASDPIGAGSPNWLQAGHVARTLIVSGVTLVWPEQLWAQALIRTLPNTAWARFDEGNLTLRVTPSGVPLAG